MKEAMYYKKLDKKKVQCVLCPRKCIILDGNRGNCGTRQNNRGKLYSVVYGKPCSANVDPLSKKPIFHMLPGTMAYSIATAGCQLHCMYCFTPETNISTEKGIMTLEELFKKGFNERKIGDGFVKKLNNPKAITHNGNNLEVLHAFKHHYNGDLIVIKPNYTPEIKCTPEHEIFVSRKTKLGSIKKIMAKDITHEDYLVIPKNNCDKDVLKIFDIKEMIDIPKIKTEVKTKYGKFIDEILKMKKEGYTSRQIGNVYGVSPNCIRNLLCDVNRRGKDFLFYREIYLIEKRNKLKFRYEKGKWIPRFIGLNEDVGRLFGYYCAEGHVSKLKDRPNSYSLVFSFGKREIKEVEEVKQLIKKIFDIDMRIRERKSTITAEISKSSLALLFKILCGSGARNKKVPWFINKSGKRVIHAFLTAYNKGDGWSGNGEHAISMNTVSRELALGIYQLLLKLNYLPGFYIWKPHPKKRIEKRIVNQSTLYYVKMYIEKFRKKFVSPDYNKEHRRKSLLAIKFKENKDYFFIPIDKISKEQYNGQVYNIEVKDDHSYLANFVAVGNCQNWNISQSKPEEVPSLDLPPKAVVEDAILNNCKSIAYTYTDPVVFYEYTLDTAKIARKKGLKNVIVCNGFINEEPLLEWCKYIDAANIDLKGNAEFYKKMTGAWIEPVLNSLKILKEKNVWLEVTNLIVPGYNDTDKELKQRCEWIKENLGSDVALHFSRFFPYYKLTKIIPTPEGTLEKAKEIALKTGLRYVYIGNIFIDGAENTYCSKCKTLLIERRGFEIIQNNIKRGGKCRCGEKIAGVWK